MDETIRTSLPTEVRIALRNHKALFYPWRLGTQRHLLHPATPGGIISTSTIDLTLPTPRGRGPHAHGTPEDSLRRDRGRPALEQSSLDP